MRTINPAQVIDFGKIRPRVEPILRASQWFDVETTSLDNPDDATLSWHLAAGWRVYFMYTVGGGASWSSFAQPPRTTYRLIRSVLNPQRALNALIASLTTSLNDGRRINHRRYMEIVTLYGRGLNNTEADLAEIGENDDDYEKLVEDILEAWLAAHGEYAGKMEGALDDYGDSIRRQIDIRFNGAQAQARQNLISRGMYNTTIRETVETGIERNRQLALTDAEDKINTRQVELIDRVYKAKADIYKAILAARDRLKLHLDSALDRRLAARNQMLRAMLEFMERRQDITPSMKDVTALAMQLGKGTPDGFI